MKRTVLALLAAGAVGPSAASAASVDLPAVAGGRFEGGTGEVAAAGDLNGDGYEDVVVSELLARPGTQVGLEEGQVPPAGGASVVFGGPRLGLVDLDRLGPAGFHVYGAKPEDGAGKHVAGAGDFNGDGLADVVLAAPNAESFSRPIPGRRIREGVEGAAYVVFGSRSAADVDLANLGARGLVIKGISGADAAGAGDFNADGRADVVVGDLQVEDGAVHVIFGGTTGTVDVAHLGPRGVSFPAAPGDLSMGAFVAGAGDFNGDGISDVVAGAPTSVGAPIPDDAREPFGPGAAHVIFGGRSPRGTRLDRLGGGGLRIASPRRFAYLGYAVAGAGDVNGDGRADVIVGGPIYPLRPPRFRYGQGSAFVVFGAAGGRVAVDRLGGRGFEIRGDPHVPGLGTAVAGAGDLDGDGFAEVLVGAADVDGDPLRGDGRSRAYVVSGAATNALVRLQGAATGAEPRVSELRGLPGDGLGYSLAATDFDGDRRNELVLGAGGSCGGGARAETLLGERWGAELRRRGAVYVYRLGAPPSAPPGIAVGGPGGDRLAGTPGDDRIAGRSGDDDLSGLGGGDCVFGEAGSDRLSGGAGGDALLGGDGADRLRGGDGPDALRGDTGDDVVDGGRGQDGLLGGPGDDRVFGGPGADQLEEEGRGDDRLEGGPGDDEMRADHGRNVLDGGTGDDTLLGGSGVDLLRGGAGDDRLVGDLGGEGGSGDRLEGGPGNDRLYGDAGRDVLIAGPGNDTIDSRLFGRDTVLCGPGRDRVRADRGDRLSGCEVVTYRRDPRLPGP